MANQTTSPFKDVAEFDKELTAFAIKFRTTIAEHSRRISDYFEMSCFNMIVRHYEHLGYSASVKNRIEGCFRFKCSTTGLLDNFSYMKVTKDGKSFRIYHNASVQSAHDKFVFTTPDIVIAEDVTPTVTTDYYKTKKRFSYLPNNKLVSFCEAKHYTPFPELMFNFIGIVNELMPKCLKSTTKAEIEPQHIAPSLMMSGSLSKPTGKISDSLQKRYYINMFSDLFINPYRTVFVKSKVYKIASLYKKRIEDYEEAL